MTRPTDVQPKDILGRHIFPGDYIAVGKRDGNTSALAVYVVGEGYKVQKVLTTEWTKQTSNRWITLGAGWGNCIKIDAYTQIMLHAHRYGVPIPQGTSFITRAHQLGAHEGDTLNPSRD